MSKEICLYCDEEIDLNTETIEVFDEYFFCDMSCYSAWYSEKESKYE